MGDGKGDVGHTEALGKVGGTAIKLEGWPSAALPHDLDFQPAHALADASAEGFCGCFLGGKTGGKAFRGVALAKAIGLFRGGENAVEKAAAKAVNGLLDAPDLGQIDSGPDNHAVNQATTEWRWERVRLGKMAGFSLRKANLKMVILGTISN